MRQNYEIGDKIKISPDNDNENYKDFRNKSLKIIKVSLNKGDHPGFDECIKEALYDLETDEKQKRIITIFVSRNRNTPKKV